MVTSNAAATDNNAAMSFFAPSLWTMVSTFSTSAAIALNIAAKKVKPQ